MITTDLPVSLDQLTEEHEAAIAAVEQAMNDQVVARLALADLEYQRGVCEAEIIIAGVDGKNETERRANLVLALEADADWKALGESIRAAKGRVADAERRSFAGQERCRRARSLLAIIARAEMAD